jgi:hypothetical protein
MKINNYLSFSRLALIAARIVLAGSAQAALVSVDINDPALPANTQSGFSPLVSPAGSFSSFSGTFGSVSVTVSGLGELLQSALRLAPTNSISTNSPRRTTSALYQDLVYGGAAVGNGLSISLSGLAAGQNYSITIWSFDASSAGARVSDWTANGALVANKFSFNGNVWPNDGEESAFTFTTPASTSGQILITGIHDSSQSAGAAVFLNAIQVSSVGTAGVPTPYRDSWLTNYSGRYARVYTNNAMKTAGTSLTAWSNGTQVQSSPAYAGVQEVYSSSNWLYLRTSGLASHTMGPWLNGSFPNLPKNQNVLYRIPMNPVVHTATNLTGLGAIGYFVDGVSMFDSRDAFYWNGTTEVTGTGSWNREAYVNEGATFDPGYAHQENTGTHHYHADPVALRYELGDHVDFDATTKTYSESTNPVTKHSPILGWVRDGYPVYGPYGFSNPSNSASSIRRMLTGFQLRNGQNGSDTLSTRTTIPLWASRMYGTPVSQSGPTVSTSYPLGRYMEDNAYFGDLVNPNTGSNFVQGVDFDLNEYNARFCVTPEFPNGTWAYFVCISSNGTPVFPYNIGRCFFGNPTGAAVTSITEAVTTNFLGGPNLAPVLNRPAMNNGTITLTWSATEGGTYRVDSTTNFTGWTTAVTGIPAVLDAGGYTNTGPEKAKFFRVARTSLATYDPVGGSGSSGGNGILSVSPTSGNRGTTFTLTITLDPSVNPPPQMAPVNSVTVGGISGTNNIHFSSTQVTSSISILALATPGPQTVTVVFPGPPNDPTNTKTYTLPNGFTIQ